MDSDVHSILLRRTEPCQKVPSASLTPYDVCRRGGIGRRPGLKIP